MAFTVKDWKDYDPGTGVGDPSTPITAAALEDMETRLSNYVDSRTSQLIAPYTTQTASFTLANAMLALPVPVNVGTGVTATVTVPLNSSVALPVGWWCEIDRMGAGIVTMFPQSGVSLLTAGGSATYNDLRAQYSSVVVRKIATDTWFMTGDLA